MRLTCRLRVQHLASAHSGIGAILNDGFRAANSEVPLAAKGREPTTGGAAPTGQKRTFLATAC